MERPSDLETESLSDQKPTSPRAGHKGRLTCQQCQTTLTIPVDNPQRAQRLYLQCPCGMQYEIITGSRRYNRKKVQLAGIYQDAVEASKAGKMTVENISFGGLRFRAKMPHTIALQDRLLLQFVLDEGSQTCITESVEVRFIENDIIGVMFINANAYTPALAAYLIQ